MVSQLLRTIVFVFVCVYAFLTGARLTHVANAVAAKAKRSNPDVMRAIATEIVAYVFVFCVIVRAKQSGRASSFDNIRRAGHRQS